MSFREPIARIRHNESRHMPQGIGSTKLCESEFASKSSTFFRSFSTFSGAVFVPGGLSGGVGSILSSVRAKIFYFILAALFSKIALSEISAIFGNSKTALATVFRGRRPKIRHLGWNPNTHFEFPANRQKFAERDISLKNGFFSKMAAKVALSQCRLKSRAAAN